MESCEYSYLKVPIHRTMSARTLNHNSRLRIKEDFNITPHASRIDFSQRTKSSFRLSTIMDYSKVAPTIHEDLALVQLDSQSEGSSSDYVGVTLLKQARIVRCEPSRGKSIVL